MSAGYWKRADTRLYLSLFIVVAAAIVLWLLISTSIPVIRGRPHFYYNDILYLGAPRSRDTRPEGYERIGIVGEDDCVIPEEPGTVAQVGTVYLSPQGAVALYDNGDGNTPRYTEYDRVARGQS